MDVGSSPTSSSMEKRFFIDRDESGDYYCVPLASKDAWDEWVNGGYEENSTPPKGCFYIGEHANCITFTDPK